MKFTNCCHRRPSEEAECKIIGTPVESIIMTNIYHEKQVRELCALHSLNNLFQNGNAFTRNELDYICNSLSPDNWINPHKSIFGIGNYDINVIMAALAKRGCAVIWFDKRKDAGVIALDRVFGFILNIPSEYRFGPIQLPIKRRHWIAVRSIKGIYYNLDSKLDIPEMIGKDDELINYFRNELLSKEKELFIVVSQEVEQTRGWCLDAINSGTAPLVKSDSIESAGQNLDVDAKNVKNEATSNGSKHLQESLSFDTPGLKYIDQDSSSIAHSREGNLDEVESVPQTKLNDPQDFKTPNGVVKS